MTAAEFSDHLATRPESSDLATELMSAWVGVRPLRTAATAETGQAPCERRAS